MTQNISGRFETAKNANAAAALISRYIPSRDISVAGLAFKGYVTIDKPVFVSDRDAAAAIMVSVRVAITQHQSRVISSLRTNGAADIVQVESDQALSDPVVAPQVADSRYN